MFCRRNTWEAAKFPRNLFCESRSRRGRVLMHSKVSHASRLSSICFGFFKQRTNKMIIAVFVGAGSSNDDGSDSEADSDIMEVKMEQEDVVGYAYVGSHNFTPSAWGTLSGTGFTPVLNVSVSAMRCRPNSNLGQVTNYELGLVFPLKDEAEMDRVVCYERPPKRYGSRDRPWASFFFLVFC